MKEYIPGFVFLVLGGMIKYWRGRRKFNRRNLVGAEGFSNYKKAVVTRWMESLAGTIANLLLVVGLTLFVIAHSARRGSGKGTTTKSIITVIHRMQ